ncbi:helix-turn-helix domain-containing protein [Pseudobacteriovorax antillogorgiicola]|uniref:Transcriptional regulator, contains XRE-family HTH domain n=1 Tax=Pseudobacteriovorax antillogorgiicola TaxID=1513793 RepID=A0A1Y6C3T0_9BACT|nr:helix-turn-helix transcriptional regulator [Pseudobacteriovorax antillogorgiicola]TCS50795.1 transcriptional regulator with XRE-family HTH domain [Pseudobacteriovorax antillogorgiicola]SMF41594.1 Transcriptional regulator, contains XRE-family HTH domain [Pseudobacteriovorax antillogorgiicola]
MILAEKVVSLRKKAGWSQEDLAERLDVSRQSVSKWESSNSTPDPNKIILLADIFEVSTDYLLRDKQEVSHPSQSSKKNEATQLHLEQASNYVNYKVSASWLVSKGVSLCVVSPIGLFSCLAMYEMGYFDSSRNTAVMAGLVFLLLMIAASISFFYQNEPVRRRNPPS